MTDLTHWLEGLRRPRLLLSAAKFGIAEYNRRQVERRSGGGEHKSAERMLVALIPVEEGLEAARKSGDASYVPSRHVEVLIAILAEIKTLARTGRLA